MHSQNEPSPSTQRDLAEEIYQLRKYMKKVNSPRRRITLGVIGGIAGALGATIIAAPILIYISKFLRTLGL